MKIYVTKYALTLGIEEHEAVQTNDKGYAWFRRPGDMMETLACRGEWFETREGAEDKAEAMRKRKIASLKRQIAKLEKMRF